MNQTQTQTQQTLRSSLAALTASQYAEWLTASERHGELEDGGVRVDRTAEPDDLPQLGDLLDHPPTERVYAIVGFRAGNATLQICPVGMGLVSVALIERKDADIVFGDDPKRLCVLLGGDQ